MHDQNLTPEDKKVARRNYMLFCGAFTLLTLFAVTVAVVIVVS